jgi:hypothetical protein
MSALHFARAKPLQALKLGAVITVVVFGLAGFVGLLPGQELGGLLFLAFFPMVLAAVVAVETLLAGYRLARTDEPVARLTARPAYTAIRGIEAVAAVLAPVTFYVLIVEIGSETAGPSAIGLLFVGVGLGLVALGAVLLRTLVEYYYHRRNRTSPTRVGREGDAAE